MNATTTSPRKTHFHRRSSVGLPSKDSESGSESEEESDLIENSNTIVSSSPKADSSAVAVVVNNTK